MPVYMSPVGMGGVVSNPLTVGLVANWRCNEASGNLLDSTANANDLTAVNAPGATTGKVNGCRTFNGSSQYATHTSNAILERAGKSWCINFWLYRTGGGFNVAVSKDDNGATRVFDIGVRGDNGHVYVNNGASFAVAESTTAISGSTWYNVHFDFTTGTKAFNLYLNNSLEHSGTLAAEFAASTSIWQIGAGAGVGLNLWPGNIDNVLLYDVVVSSTVRGLLWNGGSGVQV